MPSERKNIIFDSQILNSVQLCGMRTDLQFNKDLQWPEKPTPMEEGDLLHRMFEFSNLRIKDCGPEILYSDSDFETLIKDSISHGESEAMTLGLYPGEVNEVIFQFDKYTRHNRMSGIKILEVEKPFLIELYSDDDLRILYAGKIDRLTDTPNFGIVPRDYKSARRTQEPEPLSNQFSGYSFAMGASTVFIDKVGFQKTLSPEERFRSYPLFYTDAMLERWRQTTIWWGKQYAFFIEENTWPENRTSCDKYNGCLFIPICRAATDEARSHIMQAQFIVGNKWNPTLALSKGHKENK